MSTQTDWRRCQKCQVLFYDGYPNKGLCEAGGGHQSAFLIPIPIAHPLDFMPSYDVPETATAQAAWRYCTKCHAMFFDGYPEKGACPAGSGHAAQGYVFVLPHDVPESANAETAWRYCARCHALFYDGGKDKGVCRGNLFPPLWGGPPKHGGHEAAGYTFVLPHDLPPPPPPAPEWFAVDAPSITFGSGIAVGGYGRLTVFSDGTTHFQGHLHDSGFPSYDCLAVFTVKDADGYAYAAPHSGRVHGTDESGSRDLDWDDWGTNDRIAQNWDKIRSGATGGSQVNVTSDWSPQKIAEDIVAIVGAVLSVIPLVFSGGSSNKSSDPNYGRPEDYPPGGLPPPDQQVGDTPH